MIAAEKPLVKLPPLLPPVLAGAALCGCTIITEETIAQKEVARYSRVEVAAAVGFAPGALSRADAATQQIMFPPYARVSGKPVTCRSDVVVDAAGRVVQICTSCTDGAAENVRTASNNYAAALRYKPGAEGRRGAMTFAYAPQRVDGSLIVPRIPAPAAGCEPQAVDT